jgi:hypothetical protein
MTHNTRRLHYLAEGELNEVRSARHDESVVVVAHVAAHRVVECRAHFHRHRTVRIVRAVSQSVLALTPPPAYPDMSRRLLLMTRDTRCR